MAHLRRWPRMIVPTFELRAIACGLQAAPGSTADHVCDFEDGVRLIVCVTQDWIGSAEQLEVVISVASSCEMYGIDQTSDHWLRVLIERLVEIDPNERPRLMKRYVETSNGVLIAIFDFQRAEEEAQTAQAIAAKGLEAYPLGCYLELFTIYARPADYPETPFVVRRLVMFEGLEFPAGGWAAYSIAGAREFVPQGKVNIGRQPQDQANIVEVWG